MKSVKWKVRPISYYDPLERVVGLDLYWKNVNRFQAPQDVASCVIEDLRRSYERDL